MGARRPNGSGSGDPCNSHGNNLIAKYSFEGKMKDGPISKLTITKTGHRSSHYKKISDALPVLCADKNYRGLDEVLRTGRDQVKTDFISAYPDATQWSTTHHVQISTVDPEADAAPNELQPVSYTTIQQTQLTS